MLTNVEDVCVHILYIYYICIYIHKADKISSWAWLEIVAMPGENLCNPLGYGLHIYCVIQICKKKMPFPQLLKTKLQLYISV